MSPTEIAALAGTTLAISTSLVLLVAAFGMALREQVEEAVLLALVSGGLLTVAALFARAI